MPSALSRSHLRLAELVAEPGQGHPPGRADRTVEVGARGGVHVDGIRPRGVAIRAVERRLDGQRPTACSRRGRPGATLPTPTAPAPWSMPPATTRTAVVTPRASAAAGVSEPTTAPGATRSPNRLGEIPTRSNIGCHQARWRDVVEEGAGLDAGLGDVTAGETLEEELLDQEEVGGAPEEVGIVPLPPEKLAGRPGGHHWWERPSPRRRRRGRAARRAQRPRPPPGCRARRWPGPAGPPMPTPGRGSRPGWTRPAPRRRRAACGPG